MIRIGLIVSDRAKHGYPIGYHWELFQLIGLLGLQALSWQPNRQQSGSPNFTAKGHMRLKRQATWQGDLARNLAAIVILGAFTVFGISTPGSTLAVAIAILTSVLGYYAGNDFDMQRSGRLLETTSIPITTSTTTSTTTALPQALPQG